MKSQNSPKTTVAIYKGQTYWRFAVRGQRITLRAHAKAKGFAVPRKAVWIVSL